MYFSAYVPARSCRRKFSAEVSSRSSSLCAAHVWLQRPYSWDRCERKDAVNKSFSGQSGKMKATGVLRLKARKQQQREHHAELELLLKGQSGETAPVWNCAAENTMCHFVANCTHTGARQWPYQHTFMRPHHTLPFLSALYFVAVHEQLLCNHTLGLLFDFTSVLRRLRQARPGISAMWLKNGNRRQEYKRRHTGCGGGSVAEEWVVD